MVIYVGGLNSMPPFWNLTELLNQSQATGARSTIMQPLIWLIGLITFAILAGSYYGVAPWLLTVVGTLWVISVITFLVVFLIFLFRNPDLLRTERFTLSKMAIEKNLIGDSSAGFTEIAEFQEVQDLSAPSEKFLEGGK